MIQQQPTERRYFNGIISNHRKDFKDREQRNFNKKCLKLYIKGNDSIVNENGVKITLAIYK